jgi:hypothetical protein
MLQLTTTATTKSLKMKWEDIKRDGAKYCGAFQVLKDLDESDRTNDDLII